MNNYSKPLSISNIFISLMGDENKSLLEANNNILNSMIVFILDGMSDMKHIDLDKKLSIKYGDRAYSFSIKDMLDTEVGLPVLCYNVIVCWELYSKAVCPLQIVNDEIAGSKMFNCSIIIDNKSDILFITLMLIFWDVARIEFDK